MAHIDLHLHSTFSDGRDGAERIAERACAEEGLAAIALTDHDTAEGNEALRAAVGGRLKVLDGIEISTEWRGVVLHLLGYFPPGGAARAERVRALCWDNAVKHRFEAVLRWAPAAVIERMQRRRREFLGAEAAVDTAAVIAEIEEIYRQSTAEVARALGRPPRWPVPPAGRLWRETVERRGRVPLAVLEAFVARDGRKAAVLARFWEEAFAAAKGRPPDARERERMARAAREDCGFVLYSERSSSTLAGAAQAVREDGGIAVLAHLAPTLRSTGVCGLDDALAESTALGVQGFEAWYPLHGEEETERILSFCAARGLYVTGGTDHHGKPEQRIGELGGGRSVPLLPIVELLGG